MILNDYIILSFLQLKILLLLQLSNINEFNVLIQQICKVQICKVKTVFFTELIKSDNNMVNDNFPRACRILCKYFMEIVTLIFVKYKFLSDQIVQQSCGANGVKPEFEGGAKILFLMRYLFSDQMNLVNQILNQKQSMQSNTYSYSSFPYQMNPNLFMNPQLFYHQYNPYYSQAQSFNASQSYTMNQSYQQLYPNQSNFINWGTEQTEMKLPKMTISPFVKQEDNVQQQNDLPIQNVSIRENEEDNSNKGLQKVETVRHVKKSLSQIIQNRRGHWTNEEHYKYLKFVRQHKELFQTSVQKKLNRVFKMMSIEIPTRTACQCRSHYSKFNPFDANGKVRRKLVNDEQVYERMFQTKQQSE